MSLLTFPLLRNPVLPECRGSASRMRLGAVTTGVSHPWGCCFLWTITSSIHLATMEILGVGGGNRTPNFAAEVGSCPHATATVCCVCWHYSLPCHPPLIPEIAFSALPCLLSVIFTHQKLTKLLSPKFLLIRNHVFVILVICTFKKI